MANSPIEIMVKLTYNIIEVIYMAEFCLDCWNKLNNTNDSEKIYKLSKDKELCEGCGEVKNIIIMTQKAYYLRKYRVFLFPFKCIYVILYVLFRLLILPYLIFKYRKELFK